MLGGWKKGDDDLGFDVSRQVGKGLTKVVMSKILQVYFLICVIT
jgi:hypothetical protein